VGCTYIALFQRGMLLVRGFRLNQFYLSAAVLHEACPSKNEPTGNC
jgi:hypothetical protein